MAVLPKELPKAKFMVTLTAIKPAEAAPTSPTRIQRTFASPRLCDERDARRCNGVTGVAQVTALIRRDFCRNSRFSALGNRGYKDRARNTRNPGEMEGLGRFRRALTTM